MVGRGPDKMRWQQLARRLGIFERIVWVPWLNQDELSSEYATHHVLLFPSLHDSGGIVVLEAMRYGLPIVCLGIGGPGIIVDKSCGRVIEVAGRAKSEVIRALSDAMIELGADRALRHKLSVGAKMRARKYTWDKVVNRIYDSTE